MSQPSFQSFADLFQSSEFIHRHVGISQDEKEAMLKAVGADSMASFIEQTVPASVRLSKELDLPLSMTEHDALAKLRGLADKIKVNKSYIGLGYYPTRLPAVIARNVLENPGWYTAYTPYQAEIAQGRLEALLNFQQVCIDLSGLELAGASLLDEATAAAEAMAMAKRVGKSKSNQFFVDSRIYPQTLDVIKTRAKYFGWEIVVGDFDVAKQGDFFGAIFQYVGSEGDVVDLTDIISEVKAKGTQTIVTADVMSLVLLKSPGSMGVYVKFPPYIHHGAPSVRTMVAIHRAGLSDRILKEFPGLGHTSGKGFSWEPCAGEYVLHDVVGFGGTGRMRVAQGLPHIEGTWERV